MVEQEIIFYFDEKNVSGVGLETFYSRMSMFPITSRAAREYVVTRKLELNREIAHAREDRDVYRNRLACLGDNPHLMQVPTVECWSDSDIEACSDEDFVPEVLREIKKHIEECVYCNFMWLTHPANRKR
jgi:hypothetical protein